MDKYVCKGTCGGTSEVPGTCNDEACPNFGKPLELEKCSDCGSDDSKSGCDCGCCGAGHEHKE